jgi:hypothetical protein
MCSSCVYDECTSNRHPECCDNAPYIELSGYLTPSANQTNSKVNATGPAAEAGVANRWELGGAVLPLDVVLQIADANDTDYTAYRHKPWPR